MRDDDGFLAWWRDLEQRARELRFEGDCNDRVEPGAFRKALGLVPEPTEDDVS